MTLDEYIALFTDYFGLTEAEQRMVKKTALKDRDAARTCFHALARDIAADPRHGINERLRQRKDKHEAKTDLFATAA